MDSGDTEYSEEREPVTWPALLESAIAIGLSHDEFWGMSLREFHRTVRIRTESKKTTDQTAWWRTACETSAIVNMIGGSLAGKKWEPLSPKHFFDSWTGSADPVESIEDRIHRFERAAEEIKQREGW